MVDLLKAEEGGSGEGGEAGVDVNSISVLGQTLLEHHRVGLHQKALHHKLRKYVEYRAVSASSKILTPHTPSPPSECVLPPHQRRGINTRRAVRGWGSMFWKTPAIGLAFYTIISLRPAPVHSHILSEDAIIIIKLHWEIYAILLTKQTMRIETGTAGIGIPVFGISVQDYSSTRPGRFQHPNFRHLGIRLPGFRTVWHCGNWNKLYEGENFYNGLKLWKNIFQVIKKTRYNKYEKFIYQSIASVCIGIPASHCTENPIYVFSEMKLCSLVPIFHINVSVSNLYIPTISSSLCCSKIGRPFMGIYKSLTKTWMEKLGDRTLYFVLEITRPSSFISGNS